ncbi:MAG: hypothetical protein HY237_00450 [Acidobacteria bacterium]|nr:hypothetical protein [Acidobacteriota bacterium]
MSARPPLLFDRAKQQASGYLRDAKKQSWLPRQVACKADKHKEFLVDCWGNLQVLMRLVRAWAAGR